MHLAATVLVALLVALAAPAAAQEPVTATGVSQPVYPESVVEEFRVPTPHGSLYGWVRRPVVEPGRRVPVILTYSPYHLNESQSAGVEWDRALTHYFVPRGYARAWVHLVGTGKSEGCYHAGGPADGETGAAAVEWLAAQPWSNGRVAMAGTSYDGTAAWATAVNAPPHLSAVIPQAAIARWYDYVFTGGVRNRASSGFPYSWDAFYGNGIPDGGSGAAVLDTARPCETLAQNEEAFAADPVYGEFWDARDHAARAAEVRAAVLLEHSWTDMTVGPANALRMWRSLPQGVEKRMVVALQGHYGSTLVDAMGLRHAFLDRHLLGLSTNIDSVPPVDTTDVATGRRSQHPSWPPPGARTAQLALATAESAGTLALRGSSARWQDLDPQLDERDVLDGRVRGAGIVFTGPPVEEEVRIVDAAALDIPLATNRASTHLQAVLFDETPAGQRAVIARGALNSRNRDGERVSEPLPADGVWRARLELGPTDYVLRKGHRLGLALMSANQTLSLVNDDTMATNEVLLDRGGRLRVTAAGNAAALGPVLAPPAAAAGPRVTRIVLRRRAVRGTASGASRVQVSVTRLGRRCRALTRRGRLRARGRCTRWLPTRGTDRWSLRLRRPLPRGTYRLRARAVGADGTRERATTASNTRVVVVSRRR